MAKIHGKGGSVTFTGMTAGVYSFDITHGVELADSTDFSDAPYRKRIAGLEDWSAVVRYYYDDTPNTIAPGDSDTLTCTMTSGDTYSGAAIVESMRPAVTVDGIEVVEVTFQGNGQLTPPS